MTQDLATAMREGMRRLAAGVSVLSTLGIDGQPYAMTVTSVTSVTDEPASLLVCVNKSTRIHDHLQPGRELAINVLSVKQQNVSIACSTGEQTQSRFAIGDWHKPEGKVPLLQGAEASFSCVISELHSYGTHTVVIADITEVKVSKTPLAPLLYHNGGYQKLKR